MADRSIAIVGGGVGGLVLARVLQIHGIPATVYELDSSAGSRDQGGTLDLHPESGQRALREAGLYDEFLRLVRPEGQAMRILDKTGAVLFDEGSENSDGDRPEIDRVALREMLIASLEPGRIAWAHKVSRVTALSDNRYELGFTDGKSAMADLLIGADGAWSKVRPLLSPARPEYCGISFLDMHFSDVDRRHPAAAALVGSGTMFALSDNKGLIGQRNGGGRIRVYAALRVAEDWITSIGVDWTDPRAARAALLEQFSDWSTALTDLIRNADTIAPRLIYALPVGHRWPRIPGVTLLGDAAHLMSPFAGEGANLAMLDAAELGLALVAHGDDVEAAIADYEATMFPRSEEAATESAAGLEMCFNAEGPRGILDFFMSARDQFPAREEKAR